MPRNRVLSFMSQWGPQHSRSSSTEYESHGSPKVTSLHAGQSQESVNAKKPHHIDTTIPQSHAQGSELNTGMPASPRTPTTPSRARGDSRVGTRPNSMIQTYQPLQMEVASNTPPELAPIFSYLNSHSNKLYHEGYFLKLHDLDSRGRQSADRKWNECFAQLVGTVLSLWDAAALDAAGEDGEVVPTFINLSDASLKMIESLPMNGAHGGSLQNVLSVSTAANNRYLLHFNSLSSLTQWTAGIRLAMYEHATLQEAYTGSLIAGKGKFLNNIKQIMERSRFAHEDWVRVRFGAGTPWRRCWCVIIPPDEKEYNKSQKMMKKNPYERMRLPKGLIKFYDTRKVTKKTRPIATISDAFAAYAIYPQSKPLIDQSTLVKLEGLVTQHVAPETTTEAFVFIMPEVHPAVSGFEMMLRWLFPVWDTFNLYGRPNRLIADVLDQRGIMFAMPRDRRYGYLDILDVSGLIHTVGSHNWSERQWRKELKKLTSARMSTRMEEAPRASQQLNQRRATISRTSLPGTGRPGIKFDDGSSTHSSPGSRSASPVNATGVSFPVPKRTDSAPPQSFVSPHKRSASEAVGYKKYISETPSRLSQDTTRLDDYEDAPTPPRHGGALGAALGRSHEYGPVEQLGPEENLSPMPTYEQVAQRAPSPHLPPPAPVLSPPPFAHSPNSRPAAQLYQAPELRRAHSNVDQATLFQMQDAHRHESGADNESPRETQNATSSQTSTYLPYRPHDSSEQALAPAYSHDRGQNGTYTTHDTRQRLSTIPGSPFVSESTENTEYFQKPSEHANQMPALEESAERLAPSNINLHPSQRPELTPLHSNQSISRKPVPKSRPQVPSEAGPALSGAAKDSQVRTDLLATPDSPPSPVGSYVGALIDQDALERILNNDITARSGTMSTHVSSTTPDYASTVSASSLGERKSIEKPRAGRMKTVGDPNMPAVHMQSSGAGRLDTYTRDLTDQSADMPHIDFGPTYVYKPTHRLDTSDSTTPGDKTRSRSRDKLRNNSRDRLSGYFEHPSTSPGLNNRHSYFGQDASTPMRDESPVHASSNRNSIAWIPPAPPGSNLQPRESLSPEQWVQHRAAMASQQQQAPPRRSVPVNSHQRLGSSHSVHQLRQSTAKTPPPLTRAGSGDLAQLRDRPQSRPSSRGAGAVLNSSSNGVNLTAKEQMHVARATGTSLLGMSSSPSRRDTESVGLVGALAVREREKAAVNEGMRSGQVQRAIAARYQQQSQMEFEAERQRLQMQQQLAQQQAYANQFQQMAYQKAGMTQSPISYAGQEQTQYPTPSAYTNYTTQLQSPASPSPPTPGGWRQSFGPARRDQMQQALLQQQAMVTPPQQQKQPQQTGYFEQQTQHRR